MQGDPGELTSANFEFTIDTCTNESLLARGILDYTCETPENITKFIKGIQVDSW
jgi:hypothetical protein